MIEWEDEEGNRVIKGDDGWFYPQKYDANMEDFVSYMDKHDNEIRYQHKRDAIEHAQHGKAPHPYFRHI